MVEVQFADYVYPGYDQIVSEAARLRYRSAGDFAAPITIRMPCGGGNYGASANAAGIVGVCADPAAFRRRSAAPNGWGWPWAQ